MSITIQGDTVFRNQDGCNVVCGDMSASNFALGEMPKSMNLWLDGNDRATIAVSGSASSVLGWRDKSGHGNNFIQTVVSRMPTYFPSISGINSVPCINFDGTTDFLYSQTGLFTTSHSGDMWVIINGNDITGARCVFGTALSTSNIRYMIMYFVRTGNREGFAERDNLNSAGGGIVADFGQPQNNVNYIQRFYSSGNIYGIDRNGVQQAFTAGGTNNGNWFGDSTSSNQSFIGATWFNNNNPVQFFRGRIGEIIYFDQTVLKDIELEWMKMYVRKKWGLTVS